MAQSLDALYAEKERLQSILDGRSVVNEDQNTSAIGDTITDIKRGTQQLPGAIAGVGDIIPGALFNATPFDTATDYIGEATGFQPGRWAEEARSEYSPARQEADQRLADAEGFLDTFATGITEPRAVAGMVAESLPMMLAGGAIGRGLMKAGAVKSGAVAVGAGEGAISGGMQMESLGEQGVDPNVAALASAATGVAVGAFGVGGATLAQKMKIADPELVLAGLTGGAATRPAVNATTKSLAARMGDTASRMGRGALQEGLFEEAPQSIAETAIANLATGQDITEGLGEAAASGILAGGAMGGAFNIKGRGKPPAQTADEVTKAAEAAGFNLDTPSGQQELRTLMQQEGDPVENAIAARKTLADNFVSFTERAIDKKGNGIGDKRAPKLRAMLDGDGMNSQEGIDAAVKGLRTDIQNAFKSTNHYKNLPATEAEVQAKAAQAQDNAAEAEAQGIDIATEQETTTTPVDTPVVPAPAPVRSRENQATYDEVAASLRESGYAVEELDNLSEEEIKKHEGMVLEGRQLTDEEIADAPTQADLIPEAPAKTKTEKMRDEVAKTKAAAVPTTNMLKGEKLDRVIKGIAGLMSGVTNDLNVKSLASQRRKAKASAGQQLRDLKAALPQYYNKNGRPKAASKIPPDLKSFLDNLKSNVEKSHTANNGKPDGRLLAGIQRTGEHLAAKYSNDEIRVQVNSLVYGHKRLNKAKAVGPVNLEVRKVMNNLKSEGDPAAAGYVHDLFTTFHKIAENFDQKLPPVSKYGNDQNEYYDYLRDEEDVGRKPYDQKDPAFDNAQRSQTDAGVALIHGRDKIGSRDLAEMSSQLGEILTLIEEAIGKDNLAGAQQIAKGSVWKTRPNLKFFREGAETSAGVRFHALYRQFKDHGVIGQGINQQPARLSSEETALLKKTNDPEANVVTFDPAKGLPDQKGRIVTQLERNMVKQQENRNEPAAPALLLLDTITQHSLSPVSRSIASKLKAILENSDYADSIVVKFAPDKKSPSGASGSFVPMVNDKKRAVLTLWRDGHSEEIILHEAIHAVTAGLVSQYEAGKFKGPRSTPKKAMQDLEALRDAVVPMLAKEPGMASLHEKLTADGSGLHEFISYGLTNAQFQAWMRKNKPPKGKKFSFSTVWATFAGKLKSLLNLQHLNGHAFNNLLNTYVDSVSAVLGEADYAGQKSINAFFYTKPPKAKNKSPITLEAAADLTKPWPGKYSSASATDSHDTATKNEQNMNAKKVAEKNKDLDENAAIKADQERTEEDEIATADRLSSQETTAVTPQDNIDSTGGMNANPIDRLERNVANGVVNFLSPEHNTYEEWANSLWDKAGEKIKEMSARDGYISQTLGKILSKVVDQFGAPDAFRNMMGAFESTFRGKFNEMYTAYEVLLGLTPQQQQGLLNYAANNDKEQLRAIIGQQDNKEDAEEQFNTVVNVVRELKALMVKARDLGIIDKEKYLDTDLIDFIDLSESEFRVVNKTTYNQITPAEGADNIVRFGIKIPKTNMLGRRGKPLENVGNKQFLYAVRAEDNTPFFIEKGADVAVWDKLGLAPTERPEHQHPFRVKNPNAKGNTEFVLERRITIQERIARKKAAVGSSVPFDNNPKATAFAMSALTRMAQEWNRSIEGRQIIDGMVSTNNDLEEDSKWITKVEPKGVSARRIINIGTDSALDKSRALRSNLRVPGNWAKLEDTDENRRMFGSMAGHYVAGPVYSAVVDFNDTTPVVNSELYRTALVLWKKGKTVFSPVAHVNNIMGNIVLAYYYDLPLSNLKRARKIVLWGLGSKKWQRENPLSPKDEALRLEMDAEGIRLAQAKTADFDIAAEMRLADAVRDSRIVSGIRSHVDWFGAVEDWMGNAGEFASDLYSNQDNVFRLATYMTHIQNNAKNFGPDGKVGEQVKKEAARKAEQAFVDYRIYAPYIKGARETAFPFIAWPYRMAPIMMKLMLTKPWKAANTMMAVSALNAVAYSILGGDGEEEERNLLPEWHKQGLSWMPWVPSSIRLPFGSDENAYFLNLSRTIPMADIDSVGGNGVPSILTPGGPAAILAYATIGFDPFTGKELSSGAEDTMGFLESRAEYLGRALGPGIATGPVRAYNRQQELGPLGEERNLWADLAKVLGVSMFQVNKPEASFYKDIARTQATRLFNKEISRNWRNELRQKEPDYESGVQAELELEARLVEELQKLAGDFDGS